MTEARNIKSARDTRTLRIVLVVLGVFVLVAGAGIAILYVTGSPIMPDVDDLEPFPEELKLVDSHVTFSFTGDTADVQLVLEPVGLPNGQGIDALAGHIARSGWDDGGATEWGLRAVREGGPVLHYGYLDDYLGDVERLTGSLRDGELVAFLEKHHNRGRLIVVAVG
jgi:hypothetical protein